MATDGGEGDAARSTRYGLASVVDERGGGNPTRRSRHQAWATRRRDAAEVLGKRGSGAVGAGEGGVARATRGARSHSRRAVRRRVRIGRCASLAHARTASARVGGGILPPVVVPSGVRRRWSQGSDCVAHRGRRPSLLVLARLGLQRCPFSRLHQPVSK